MLKRTLPFQTVGLYAPAIFFKGHQMRNFMDQGNQKTILVQRCIYGYLMLPVNMPPVIPVPGDPFVHYF